MVATSDFSGLTSSPWALASAEASVPIERLDRCMAAASALRRSKLMAPDFERLARTPWPIACCASSGTRLLSSALACSCSR